MRKKRKRRIKAPPILAFHNTALENVDAIKADGFLRSNAELKALGVHPQHWSTGYGTSPNTDEKSFFFYPDFAQYAPEKITYGTNTDKIETLLEYAEQFQTGIYDHAQTARYSAWVFNAERLILNFGGRLRFDHDAFERAELRGLKALKYLKKLKAFFLKHPGNKASTVCEILVADHIPLDASLNFIEDAVLDYHEHQSD